MKPGAAPAVLFDAGLVPLFRLEFSPDGTKLAVASETTQSVNVRIMTRTGASLSSFEMPSLGLGLPSWTPDGKAVLMFDRRTLRTLRIPIDNPARRTPFAAPHWVGIAIRKNGTFATRADTPGIWRIDGGIKQINSVYPSFYQPPLAFRGDDVLVPEYNPGGMPRILAQPVIRRPQPGDRLCAGRGEPERLPVRLRRQSRDRRNRLYRPGLARHQYRSADFGPALGALAIPASWGRALASSFAGSCPPPGNRRCCAPQWDAAALGSLMAGEIFISYRRASPGSRRFSNCAYYLI